MTSEIRKAAEDARSMSSDDFGHNCQLLLEAESQALQTQCEVVIKLCDALDKAIEQRDEVERHQKSRDEMDRDLENILRGSP
jgi:hypothetical protein